MTSRYAAAVLTTLALLLTGLGVVTTSTASAATVESRFSGLRTPKFTKPSNQQVTLKGRVQPAAAGRSVSLYRHNGDGTNTWVAGTHTGADGRFRMTVGVDVQTKFHFFSAGQDVGGDTYRATRSKNFTVKSLRLRDNFNYKSWAKMDRKWDIRQQGMFLPGRRHQRSDRRALGFGDGTLKMRIKRDPKPGNKGKFLVPHVTAGNLGGIVRGHLEARIKFGRPQGAHGALWWTSGYCEGQAEIDGVEFFGERKAGTAKVERQKVQHTIWDGHAGCQHSKAHMAKTDTWSTGSGAFGPTSTWWSRYHDYEVFWNTDGYRFYIDGRHVGTVTAIPGATAPVGATQPAEVVLSLLISDWEAKTLRSYLRNGGSLRDYTMRVDWIRVWR
jgi:hypothetical protein